MYREIQSGFNIKNFLTKLAPKISMKIMRNVQATIQKRWVRGRAFQKVLAVMDRVHEKNKGVSEETVVKYATQAIAELREEEYAKSHRTYTNKK